jgi:hypothetical protein
MKYIVVVAVTFAAFVVSFFWYSPLLFGNAYMELRGLDPAAVGTAPPIAKIASEIARTLVLALVLAHVVTRAGIKDWKSALGFGVVLWIGFPAVLLAGSVLWDDVPVLLAAIHSGDWLVKLLLMTTVFAVWHKRKNAST